MHERVRFIGELGKRILFVDFSNCSAREVEAIARKVPDVVTVQPRNSVLLLVDFTGASFDRDAIPTMKESAVFDKPYIKKSAWIGATAVPQEFQEEMKSSPGVSCQLSRPDKMQ